jgi:hypothetical protein
LRIAIVVATFLGSVNCVRKAGWVPNDHGGYTLSTTCHQMDDAMLRFRRTGEDLCGANRYVIGQPEVLNRGFGFSRYGGGTEMTIQAELTCH